MADKTLVKGLGRLEATTLVIGGIIGTTIFLITSDVADIVGSPALVLVTWVLAGLMAGAAALCFAELSAAMPKTGGTYVFLKRAYDSDLVAFGFAWMMCFAYGSGAIAVVAIMAGTFLMPVLQGLGLITGDYVKHTAVILIFCLTILNARGVRLGGLTQNVLTVLKVGLMLVVIFIPMLLIDARPASLAIDNRMSDGIAVTMQNIGTAMILCMFAYSGAYFVTHVAEEIRQPQRNIPKAIIGGFSIVMLLYFLINVTYLTSMTFEDIRGSEHIASDVMAAALGPKGAILTAFVIFCSAVGVLNAQLLNYPRIPFALARDGLFFAPIAELNDKYRTPANAILLVGLWSLVLSLTGGYREILTYVAFVIHFFICLAVAAVIVLRVKEPDLPRPYKVWGYPYTPIAFLAVSVWYLLNLVISKPGSVAIGVGIVLAGLPFYWYWKKSGP